MADKFEDTALGSMVKTEKPKLFIGELVDNTLPNRDQVLYGSSVVRYKDGKREQIPLEDLPPGNPKIIKES